MTNDWRIYAKLYQVSRRGMGALRQEERPEVPRVALQFLVRADFSDPAVDQDHDHVGLANRVVAMRREDDDLLVSHRQQQIEDLSFADRVQAGAGFVEDDQRRVMIEQARERQPLPLPA